MYPFVRLIFQVWKNRKAPQLDPLEEHRSKHLCLPWDLDGFMELNNGRTLSLYDLGRFGLGARMGLMPVLRAKGWGLAVAGVSVRYRKRITMFQRIDMRTRCVGWDHRFIYIVQSMWVNDVCCSQALLRTAVTSRDGAVLPDVVMEALGRTMAAPELPQWVANWIEAEGTRPWPPEV